MSTQQSSSYLSTIVTLPGHLARMNHAHPDSQVYRSHCWREPLFGGVSSALTNHACSALKQTGSGVGRLPAAPGAGNGDRRAEVGDAAGPSAK